MQETELDIKNSIHTVHYYEDSHTYFVDGTRAVSITQVLGWKYHTSYEGVDKAILNKAAEQGTAMHEAIEDFEIRGFDNNDPITGAELELYKDLKSVYGFKCLEMEKMILIYYRGIWFAGRFDELIQMPNGNIAVNDFKRYATMSLELKTKLWLQLNLYRIGIMQTYNLIINELKGTHIRVSIGKLGNVKKIRNFIDFPINEQEAYDVLSDFIDNSNVELITEEEFLGGLNNE